MLDFSHFPWLTFSIVFPVLMALFIPFVPDKGDGKTVRWYALVVGLIDFIALVYGFCAQYEFGNPDLQMVEKFTWVPQLGLNWSVGADGLSMPLILLTGFITTLAIIASWPVSLKPKLFYFLLLAMYGGQIGVFAVQDMLLFFLMWELELIPVYLLLAIWGGKNVSMPLLNLSFTPPVVPCLSSWRVWRWLSTAAIPPSTSPRSLTKIFPSPSSYLPTAVY